MGRWHLEFEMGRRSRSVTLALVLCIALACVVAGILLITLPNALASRESHEYDYGLIIDAGSSGSRIYLYTWPHRKSARTPTVSSLNDPSTNTSLALKILPGLQSYQDNYTAAGLSLVPLVEFAMNHLPENRWADTPIYLEATAGLRKLPINVSTAIIASCRDTSPFWYKDEWVRMIPGQEEAINDWMTVNVLSGLIGGPAKETLGAVEVGGASLQVAFIPDSPPSGNQSWRVEMNGASYDVYVESYMYYGLTEAKYRLNESLWDGSNVNVTNPCFLVGYTELVQFIDDNGSHENYQLIGTGDFDACLISSTPLLNLSVPCTDRPCLWNGVHQPPMRGLFHGIDNFAKALVFYNLSADYTPAELAAAGRVFCSMQWSAASAQWPNPPAPLQDYCFMAAYLYTILTSGFGLRVNDNTTFEYNMFINGTEVSWTSGAITLAVSKLPWTPPNWFASPVHLLAVLVPPVVLLAIALVIVWLCKLRKTDEERLGYEKVDAPG